MSEDAKAQINRELNELLEELRVAIPGAEVMLAFLLGMAFTQRFESVTPLQRNVYFVTLSLTAAGTALLIAPFANHRVRFRDGDKEHMLFSASRMAVAGLVLLLFVVSGVVFLVAGLLYAPGAAALAGTLGAGWFLWFWLALALVREHRSRARADCRSANQDAA